MSVISTLGNFLDKFNAQAIYKTTILTPINYVVKTISLTRHIGDNHNYRKLHQRMVRYFGVAVDVDTTLWFSVFTD